LKKVSQKTKAKKLLSRDDGDVWNCNVQLESPNKIHP